MIFKKILLTFSILFIGFSFHYAPVVAEETLVQDISDSNFTIDVGTITPTDTTKLQWQTSSKNIEALWTTVITKLITAFWVLSLLVMTIWAWFMIIYHGQDELLTRWKSIFSYGLISLVVALSAWFLVNFVSYLLYWS